MYECRMCMRVYVRIYTYSLMLNHVRLFGHTSASHRASVQPYLDYITEEQARCRSPHQILVRGSPYLFSILVRGLYPPTKFSQIAFGAGIFGDLRPLGEKRRRRNCGSGAWTRTQRYSKMSNESNICETACVFTPLCSIAVRARRTVVLKNPHQLDNTTSKYRKKP